MITQTTLDLLFVFIMGYIFGTLMEFIRLKG